MNLGKAYSFRPGKFPGSDSAVESEANRPSRWWNKGEVGNGFRPEMAYPNLPAWKQLLLEVLSENSLSIQHLQELTQLQEVASP